MKKIKIIMTKDANKNIEPLKFQYFTAFPINNIKYPVNNIKQKMLFKFKITNYYWYYFFVNIVLF